MDNRRIVSREEWLIARKQHLLKEKDLTRLRDDHAAREANRLWVKDRKGFEPSL